MPAPGDQHTAWANPFQESKPRVSEWTAREIATISARLDKQLGPEYISSRAGPGGTRVHYLTAEKCITLANEVFGFNGWSSSIQNIQVDFADENPQTQRVSIGLSVIVRVTLRDGTYHEDIGYGSIENAKGKAMAFEKAKKEGTTDGLKRALRSFGNLLGNCVYDKSYVNQVTKIKAQPVKKFDEDNLHRHSDFVKTDVGPKSDGGTPGVAAIDRRRELKMEPSDSFDDFLGELDEADFCVPDDGHPDEVVTSAPVQALPPITATKGQPSEKAQGSRAAETPSYPASGSSTSGLQQMPNNIQPRQGQPNEAPAACRQPPQQPAQQCGPSGGSGLAAQVAPRITDAEGPAPVAFFSAKAVSQLSEGNLQAASPAQFAVAQGKGLFNPKLESPSIRKTPGIDHTLSRPVARNGQHIAPASGPSLTVGPPAHTSSFTPVRPSGVQAQAGRGNVVNPSLDQARRIGMPGGSSSPLANRGSYRPPAMKRNQAGESNATNGSRKPLADVSANNPPAVGAVGAAVSGPEAKRQKMA